MKCLDHIYCDRIHLMEIFQNKKNEKKMTTFGRNYCTVYGTVQIVLGVSFGYGMVP